MIDLDPYIDVGTELVTAWRTRGRRLRLALITAIFCTVVAIAVVLLGRTSVLPESAMHLISATLGSLAGLLVLGVLAYQRSVRRTDVVSRIARAELKVEQQPERPQAAWELAQVKLETYLDRNLAQVRSIYWLTIVVMTVGFTLIGYGVFEVFSNPVDNLNASIVSAASGILVNFIGVSFLDVHRSTMAQAKDYVTILERINAVGMAVQILDTIEDKENNLRQETTAAVATEMLKMYGGTITRKADA